MTTWKRPEWNRCNQCTLSDKQWDRLLGAMRELKKTNGDDGWDSFTNTHAASMMIAHSDPEGKAWYFLPWHRCFISDFELRLREIDSRVTLPYWDWSTHPRIPKQMRKKDWMKISSRKFRIATKHKKKIKKILEYPKFVGMSHELQDIHNKIHVRVGGDMKNAAVSPNDPLFFLHHCYVDKVWADWQACHPRKKYDHPNKEHIMAPYNKSVHQASSLKTFYVKYV